MNFRLSAVLVAAVVMASGCFSPTQQNPLGYQAGGGTNSGGGSSGTGGGSAGGSAGGSGDGAPLCSTDGVCFEPRQYQGSWNGVWGAGRSLVVAVGELGAIGTFNGTSWSFTQGPTSKTLRAVWLAPGGAHGWAVGDDGTMLELVGQQWRLVAALSTATLRAVHGSDDGHVWAVGDDGTICRFVSPSWTCALAEPKRTLSGVWATSATDVTIVGVGVHLHFDGTTLQSVSSGSAVPGASDALNSVSGCGDELYVTGVWAFEAPSMWHRDGALAWGAWNNGTIIGSGVLCAGADDVWVFGSFGSSTPVPGARLARVRGGVATGYEAPAVPRAAWAAAADDVWFVGGAGSLSHFDGTTVSAVTSRPVAALALSGSAADNVWVADERGGVRRHDGAQWVAMPSLPLTGTDVVLSLYAPTATEAWALSTDSRVWHLTQGAWQSLPAAPLGTYYVTGSGPDDVWFSGPTGGTLQHWNGSTMSTVNLPPGNNPNGPLFVSGQERWSSIFNGGSGPSNALRQVGGGTWVPIPGMASYGALAGTPPHVWGVGGSGLLGFDGNLTRTVPLPAGAQATSIAGPDGSLYVTTSNPDATAPWLLYFDGQNFTPVAVGAGDGVREMRAFAFRELWLLTSTGVVMHRIFEQQ